MSTVRSKLGTRLIAAIVLGGSIAPSFAGGGDSPAAHEWWSPRLQSRGMTCDAPDRADDSCTACAREECCDAIEACDASCRSAYDAYYACLHPSGGGQTSGFSSAYCRRLAGVDATAALRLVQCTLDRCSANDACNVEPDGRLGGAGLHPKERVRARTGLHETTLSRTERGPLARERNGT